MMELKIKARPTSNSWACPRKQGVKSRLDALLTRRYAMKIMKQLLFLAFTMFLSISVAAADEKGGQAATPGPTVVSQTKYPLTMGSGDYDLITRILDFPAGAGNPNHMHGGNVLVTVLSGEMTLREKGTEKIVKAGESWTESPGNVHAVVNAGTASARVVAVFLLPKGAEATTMMK
jgi:quercetin dioxygenase-like cupin family protein